MSDPRRRWWTIAGGLAIATAFAAGAVVGYRRGRSVEAQWPESDQERPPHRFVAACIHKSAPGETRRSDLEKGVVVHGSLAAMGAKRPEVLLPVRLVRCQSGQQAYFDVQDEAHDVWRVMYVTSGLDAATPRARVGAAVTLRLRASMDAFPSTAVVLLDDEGPILATADGPLGIALPSGGEPVVVSKDDAAFTERLRCGDLVHYELRVSGDDRVRVSPGDVGAFSIGGQPYAFWNADSTSYLHRRCTDTFGSTTWFLWRK